jgi:hypothetical protein
MKLKKNHKKEAIFFNYTIKNTKTNLLLTKY